MSGVRDATGRYAPEAGLELNRAIAQALCNQTEPTHAIALPALETIEAFGPKEDTPDADGTVYLVALRGYIDAKECERRVVAEYVGTNDAYLTRDVEGARLVRHNGKFSIDTSSVTVSEILRSLRVSCEECRHVDEVAHVRERERKDFQTVLDRHAAVLGGDE